MGFVTASNEVSLVGTITSGGTDLAEMSARTARSTTDVVVDAAVAGVVVGASLDLGVVSEGVTIVVVDAAVGATDGAGGTDEVGERDEFGAARGSEVHETIRAKPAKHSTMREADRDLTSLLLTGRLEQCRARQRFACD